MHQRANGVMNWSEMTIYWEILEDHPRGIGKWKGGEKNQKKIRINSNTIIINYCKMFLLGYYQSFWFIHKNLLHTSAKLEQSRIPERTRRSPFRISSVGGDRFRVFSGGIRGNLLAFTSQIRMLGCTVSARRKCSEG